MQINYLQRYVLRTAYYRYKAHKLGDFIKDQVQTLRNYSAKAYGIYEGVDKSDVDGMR